MTCPDCGRRLIIAIYAICTFCKVAYQPHELVGAQTRVSKTEADSTAAGEARQ